MNLVVIGAGWLGASVGAKRVARGDRVFGVRRSAERAAELEAVGIEPLVHDVLEPDFVERLPRPVDAIVACQAAGRADGGAGYRRAYLEGNRAVVRAAREVGCPRVVYTGSTGVFGQTDGSTVDESTPPSPRTDSAETLAAAEQVILRAHEEPGGIEGVVVRLSGLYGPGRYGVVDRVRRGVLALGPGDDAWMNFCHLDDAVSAVLAALEIGRPGTVYHGSDAEPARRRDVVAYVAERLGIEPTRSDQAGSRPGNRRVDSTATRRELGIALAYPSFRDGLAPVLGSERGA